MVEVGGIEPQTRVVGQGLTWHCDQIVTLSRGLSALPTLWQVHRTLIVFNDHGEICLFPFRDIWPIEGEIDSLSGL